MRKQEFRDSILFENDDYIAINKPPGLSTLEDRTDEVSLLSMAKNAFSGIQLCHRLDKDTSGVLVCAKNPEGYKHLSLQFQQRKVQKVYHAVVHGPSDFDNVLVNLPLIINNKGIVKWDTKSGKESNTYFTTLKNYLAFSLVKCMPITGRRHQIRVHLKHLKHSIVADTTYEGEFVYLSHIKRNYKQSHSEERPIIGRMALHAHSISFTALNNELVTVEAPYPKDFCILLKQLEKFGS